MEQYYLISYQLGCLGILVVSALLFGKFFERIGTSEEIGQIIGGLIVGPSFLHFFQFFNEFYLHAFETFKFFSFGLLGLIAFSIGEELHVKRIIKAGWAPIIISVSQSLITWFFITIVFKFLGFNLFNSLLIGSIGIATAPAATFILMKKYSIEGEFRTILTNVIIVGDIIEIIIFSILLEIGLILKQSNEAVFSILTVLKPLSKELFFSLGIGFFLYVLLHMFISKNKTDNTAIDNVPGFNFFNSVFRVSTSPSTQTFLVIFGFLSIFLSISLYYKLPFLLIAIFSGFLISNFHSSELFDSLKISNIMQILNLVFFALIGANLELDKIEFGLMKYIFFYILARLIGKIFGTWLGCYISNQDKKVNRTLPLLMLPQAGVAAIEAFYITLIFGSQGNIIFNIILPAIIFFEIGGIILSEKTLKKWRTWTLGVERLFKKKSVNLNRPDLSLLTRLINKNLIKVPLIAEKKDDVLMELLTVFENNLVIKNKLDLFKEIKNREELSTTGFGNGIAIPHIRTDQVDKVQIAVGIKLLGDEIDFKSIDRKKCNIFFMLLSPEEEHTLHLKVLSIISFLLNNIKNRDIMSKFTTSNEVYDFIMLKCKG